MPAKRSAPKPPKAVKAVACGQKAEHSHPLRVPVLKPGEGIADLLPEEEALIQMEITQRLAKQWSQDDMAHEVGVSRSEVQHLEHRRRGVSFRVAILTCRACGYRLVMVPK